MLEDNRKQAAQADQAILEALQESESTVAELMTATGFNEMRTRRSLARLQESGKVSKDGLYFSLSDGTPADNQGGDNRALSGGTVNFENLVAIGMQGAKDGAAGIEPKKAMVERTLRSFLVKRGISWRGPIPAHFEAEFYQAGHRAGQEYLKAQECQEQEEWERQEQARREQQEQERQAGQQRIILGIAGAILTGDQKVLETILHAIPTDEQMDYVKAAATHLACLKLDAEARRIEMEGLAGLLRALR